MACQEYDTVQVIGPENAGSEAETAKVMNDSMNFWPNTSQFGRTAAQITHN
jgi:hypothetical protein